MNAKDASADDHLVSSNTRRPCPTPPAGVPASTPGLGRLVRAMLRADPSRLQLGAGNDALAWRRHLTETGEEHIDVGTISEEHDRHLAGNRCPSPLVSVSATSTPLLQKPPKLPPNASAARDNIFSCTGNNLTQRVKRFDGGTSERDSLTKDFSQKKADSAPNLEQQNGEQGTRRHEKLKRMFKELDQERKAKSKPESKKQVVANTNNRAKGAEDRSPQEDHTRVMMSHFGSSETFWSK